MMTQVAHLDQDLKIQIPQDLAHRAGIEPGTQVNITTMGPMMVITRADRPDPLQELLDKLPGDRGLGRRPPQGS